MRIISLADFHCSMVSSFKLISHYITYIYLRVVSMIANVVSINGLIKNMYNLRHGLVNVDIMILLPRRKYWLAKYKRSTCQPLLFNALRISLLSFFLYYKKKRFLFLLQTLRPYSTGDC